MVGQSGWDAVVRLHGSDGAERVASKVGLASTVARTSTTKALPTSDASEIKNAREAFTAMVLQSFLEAAVPKNLSGASKSGGANTMWRSLLVEQLAKTVSASGQLDVLGGTLDGRLIDTAEMSPISKKS